MLSKYWSILFGHTTFLNLPKGEAGPAPPPAHKVRTHTQDGRRVVVGRLPIPSFMRKEMPKGYDPVLCDLDNHGQRKYADVPVRWFKDNEEELLELARKHIHPMGFGRPPVAALFRARGALQRWMVTKLASEYESNGE